MLNQAILVGRVYDIKENVVTLNTLKKDIRDDGVMIEVKFDRILGEQVRKYVKVNDLIGVTGSLDNNSNGSLYVIAKKVTLLSKDDDKDENKGEEE